MTVLRAIKLALMYCWGFGRFSSFYYSSDYHLLFLNGICYYGIRGVCPSEENLLQQPLCSLPVVCRGDTDDPLEFGGHTHHLYNFSSTKVLCSRLGAATGAAPGMAPLLELQPGSCRGWTQGRSPSVPPNWLCPSWCCSPQILFLGSILFSLNIPPFSIRGQAALARPRLFRGSAARGFHGIMESQAGSGWKAP